MKQETVWLAYVNYTPNTDYIIYHSRATAGVKVFKNKESAETYAIQYEELFGTPVTLIEKKLE